MSITQSDSGAAIVTLDSGEEFWLKQTEDGQRLYISSHGRGSFAVQPRLANVIEIGRVK